MQSVWGFFFGTEPIEWFQHLVGLGHPVPFRAISLLGDTWGVLLAVLLAVGLAFWLFGRRALYALTAVMVLSVAAKLLFNLVFSLSRPQGPEVVVYEQLQITSFPSGHVFQAVVVWGVLYALGHVRLWVPVLAALLVSVDRLYLGVHYVGDLLGGILFGVLLVWGFQALWPPVRDWLAERPQGLYCAVAGPVVAVLAGLTLWDRLLGDSALWLGAVLAGVATYGCCSWPQPCSGAWETARPPR